MFKELAAVLGTHIDSPEFKAIQEKYFPAFKLGKNKDQYKDKATKIVLCFAALTSHDNSEPIPQDPNAFRYFTAFFFGKDESEIPFGVTSKDSEDTVYKKAGKPTHHNKILEGPIFNLANDMHYHIDNYKMVISFNPATGKNWGSIGINLRLKGMKF
jgi:hypothetical protein